MPRLSRSRLPAVDAAAFSQARRKAGGRRWLLMAILILAGTTRLATQEPQPVVPLEVTVMREGSGELLAGALVQATDGERSFLDVTDDEGIVTFEVPHGLWMVRARSLTGGLASADVSIAPGAARTRVLVVIPGK